MTDEKCEQIAGEEVGEEGRMQYLRVHYENGRRICPVLFIEELVGIGLGTIVVLQVSYTK